MANNNNELDSGLTASVTTVFDSGRSGDSGASVSRKMDDYVVEFDNRIPDSKEPLHGPSCVCLHCINKFPNLDGNDSPSDLDSSQAGSDDDHATTQAQARQKAQVKVVSQQQADDEANIETQILSDLPTSERRDGLLDDPLPGPSRMTPWSNIATVKKPAIMFPEKCKPRVKEVSEILGDKSTSSEASTIRGEDEVDKFLESVPDELEAEARAKAREDSICSFLEISRDIEELSDMTESEDEREPLRVRTGWDSDSLTNSSCDSTDYSDEDDLRNFFIDGGREDIERARTDAILGHEPRPNAGNLSIALDDSDPEPVLAVSFISSFGLGFSL